MVDFVCRRAELAKLERELLKVADAVGRERPGAARDVARAATGNFVYKAYGVRSVVGCIEPLLGESAPKPPLS